MAVTDPASRNDFSQQLKANLEGTPPAADPAQQPPPAAGQVPAGQTALEQVATPAAPKSLLERMKEFGFEGLTDEKEAPEQLLAALEDQRKTNEETLRRLQQVEELQAYREQIALQQAQQPQTTQAATQAGKTDKWWNPPQVDQAAVEFYRNDDGTWKPEAPLDLRQQVQRYDAYHKAWAEKMVRRPDEAFTPLVKELVQAELAAQMSAMQQQTSEIAAQQKFMAENAHWLYAIDPITKQPKRDPQNPDLIQLSQDGRVFDSYMRQAEALSIPSFQAQVEYAMAMTNAARYQAANGQQSAAQQAQQTNEQKKNALLASARPNPSAAGTFTRPDSGRSQNSNLTAGEKLIANMRANGHLSPVS